MDIQNQNININFQEIFFRYKQQFTIIIIAMLSLILSKSIYDKQIKQYDRLQEEIRTEKEKSEIVARIVAIDKRIKELKKSSWDSADFVAISNKIGKLAMESKVKISTLQFASKEDKGTYVAIRFTLNADGRSGNFMRFLKKLETFSMLTSIKSIKLDKVNVPKGGTLFNGSLEVEAYYFK